MSKSKDKKLPKQIVPLSDIQGYISTVLEESDETTIADLIDFIITQGAYHISSDIHLEPWTEHTALRYRIDGILHQVALIPKEYHGKLVARIKVLADLVIYRKDIPQDGRIDPTKTSCKYPLRVSVIPTIKGEKVVIRVLGETQELFHLDVLGFQPNVEQKLKEIIRRNQGTILLTGPSSSGKTTTIYALIQEMINAPRNLPNIVTIEDPVEYSMDKISQIQINPHVDFTFANALRSILRQDPEVIMVGEIRDYETARIAIQAGLTGHLVISTIHSGTSAGVFIRLIDMGIESYLVASSVIASLAQRLVRINCPDCIETYNPHPSVYSFFDLKNTKETFYRSKGCSLCQYIGYRGRACIGELLYVTSAIEELILKHPTVSQLHTLAVSLGMETMAEDGLKKARKGITTLEELIRVLPLGSHIY
ncbi:MAG TPA: GspE/PulE family protein [Candidatus Hydrogenedens sp.]|nr:GspE/PulE family protein [Candidatus Hydrogenedens sp.]HOK08328.1 GspE/PulE family protein [Candidatus Hydrogenedens sp.]HOL18878.1 GspE/PulE family protein [Candidatus Hydrogenedens sp.]HPP57622.1 GspE/PulE family protein [Candidatus Hydrogenedens sp.]